jgi:ubiquitin-conjugating enzyme E2 D
MLKRLKYEMKDIKKNPIENFSIGFNKDKMEEINATLFGPNDTPYENGVFYLTININKEYPFSPPMVKFNTPVYHPNISNSGEICLNILKNDWSPILSIKKVLLGILALLTNPNPNDPLQGEIAEIYINNKTLYEKNVRDYVLTYASS